MATVTGLTAARMLAIEAASVVDGEIDDAGHLILTTHGGTDIDAGPVLGSVPDASETVKGLVEMATTAEATAGVDTARAVTPAGLSSAVASMVPDASLTVKGKVELATTTEAVTGTDAVRAVTPAALTAALSALFAKIYPVGSVYMSAVSTNPATLFGFGTWTAIQGRFLIGADATYVAGATGGEATHVLTVAEIPSHTHTTRNYAGTTIGSGPRLASATLGSASGLPAGSDQSNNIGGGAAHNNLPPYLSVYIWKRTA